MSNKTIVIASNNTAYVAKGTHEEAPPIPPRKSLNINNSSDVVNRITQKIQHPPPLPQVTTIVLEKNELQNMAKLAQQEEDTDEEDEDSNPICGPAETISGIIVGEVSL